MTGKLKKCGMCGAERIRFGTKTFEYDWGRKYLIVIENVPMQICETCGAGFLDDPTGRRLDMIAQPIILKHRRKRKLPRPLAVVDFEAVLKPAKKRAVAA